MQLFYPPIWLLLLLCAFFWTLFQGGAAFLCAQLPARFFSHDTGLYRTRKFEDGGNFYQKYFRIRRWKHLLPDGGALLGGYRKRHLNDVSEENLHKFLLESRRAELTHWLAMPFFWVFGFFSPIEIIPLMLLYTIAVNLPCIIAQRYNRPRIQRLLRKRQPAMPSTVFKLAPSITPPSIQLDNTLENSGIHTL